MSDDRRVAVAIVTHDDATDLPACLAAVGAQTHRPLEVVTVDCASGDDSLGVARRATANLPADVPAQVLDAGANLGFAGGMNHAFAHGDAPFVLTLNADARPAPDYVARLLAHAERPRVAAVTGRLLRPPDQAAITSIDACGMRLSSAWRHFDRGSGEPDRGQYATAERVFGATGAASLFVRAALDDVAFDLGVVFDPAFHSFREDAELCFRLQARGWDVVYEPRARAEHRRVNLPARRRRMPAHVNLHSLKNRYLLRAYHQRIGNAVRTAVPTLARDAAAFAYVCLHERSSLGAYAWLWRHRQAILARRRALMRRSTHPAAVERWFRRDALPLEPSS